MDISVVIETLQKNYDPNIKDRLLNIYQLGSRVYGTATEKSDWDFMGIVKYNLQFTEDHYLWECYDDGKINVALYDERYFRLMTWEHRMEAVECIFLPRDKIWMETIPFHLELDFDVLREMVRWISQLRLSMAKKRIAKEPYKGKKCIFHALRYLTFAIQVVKNQRITNYSAANHFLSEIMEYPSDTWDQLKAKFYPIFKQLTTELDNSLHFSEFYSRMETELHMMQHSLNSDAFLKYSKNVTKETSSVLSSVLQELGIMETCKKFQLRANAHEKYPNLVHFSPTLTSTEDSIIKECNGGIILDYNHSWSVVAKITPPVVHLGQPGYKEIPLDFSSAKIYEEIDGTLVCLYWYQDHWEIGSKWESDAISVINWKRSPIALSEMFWKIWNANGYQLPPNEGKCYTFSLVTNDMRYVVHHLQSKLYFIGAFDIVCCKEVPIEDLLLANPSWAAPRSFQFSSMEEAQKILLEMNPFLHAGFVLVDKDLRRIGIRSPQFVAAMNTIGFSNPGFGPMNLNADNMEKEGILELVRFNLADEFLYFFPKWKTLSESIKLKYSELCLHLAKVFQNLQKLEDQKEFAAAVNSLPQDEFATKNFASMFFNLRKQEIWTPQQYFVTLLKSKNMQKVLQEVVLH